MKKLVKALLIAAVGLIILGSGLFVGGAVSMGGIVAAKTALHGYEFFFDKEGAHLNLEEELFENFYEEKYHKEYHERRRSE